ncbi:MAG: ABC transporter ATP-binding protein [Gaiellaceae bacterium]
MSAAVELRDVFRVHSTPEGDAAALQGLSLEVQEREALVVLGPSGSGKTTLLRILAGLDRPSAGSVRVFGTELSRIPARRLADYRAGAVGYIEQQYSRALASELTARELVGVRLGLQGVPRRQRIVRADELLERVGLSAERHARPGELSGGERQRIAVCAALAHRPRLLLADEPTGELDAGNARVLYDLLGELTHAEGCTTVVVSHDPQSTSLADRIVRIRDGRVSEETVREGAVSEGAIVVGRGGWLRLPEEYLRRAGIETRATARVEGERIVVTSADGGARVSAGDEVAAPPEAAAAGGVVLRATGLVKTFEHGPGRVAAVSDLDASFSYGKLYVVTGPSGSGKTTLLHLLAGLDTPDAGEVEVLGTVLNGLDRAGRAAFRRAHVGYVGQQPGLVETLSARENVELGLALRGVEPADASAVAVETLAAVGLAERAEQRVGRLSTGEQVRVAIARTLAPRPEVLLADEPTARLDQANALAVALLFARLARRRGATIVCATHDPVVIEQADGELALRSDAPEPRDVTALGAD